MMRTIRRVSVCLLLTAALPVCACRSTAHKPPAPQPVAEAPLTKLLREQDLTGKVVLLEVGLVGCELSDKGLGEMVRLHRDKTIPELHFVRVEGNRDAGAVERYFTAKAVPFPVVRDGDGALAAAMDATVYPRFVLVDKFGHIRYRGKWPKIEDLEEWADLLAAEKADPGPAAVVFGLVKLDGPRLLASTHLPDLQGTVVPLKERMGAGGLVVVFVDTKCPYSATSIGELPAVAAALERHKVGTVVAHLEESARELRAFYEKRKPGPTVLHDTTTATRLNWAVESVPTVVYLDATGNVAYNGRAVWKDLGAAVEKSLNLAAGTVQFQPAGTSYG